MEVTQLLNEAHQNLDGLASDVTLLEQAWQDEIPEAETVVSCIDTYLVPYYKAKGAVRILELIGQNGFDLEEPEGVLADLQQMEIEKGLLTNIFRRLLDSRTEPVDYEILSLEIQHYIKPFYELVGARDTLESLLDSRNGTGQNPAGD